MRLVRDSPVNFFFGTEWNESFLAEGVGCRTIQVPGLASRYPCCAGVDRSRREVTGKIFEPAECLTGVEGFGVERECGMGRITACAATGRFFVFSHAVPSRYRGRIPGYRRRLRRGGPSIVFALADRETVVVWSDASREEETILGCRGDDAQIVMAMLGPAASMNRSFSGSTRSTTIRR